MKVEDLKTGMRVTFKNGETSIILKGTSRGDIHSCIGINGAWGCLLPHFMDSDQGEYTVMKVEDSSSNQGFLHKYYTIWERKEMLEVSMDEIAKKFGIPVEQLKIKK